MTFDTPSTQSTVDKGIVSRVRMLGQGLVFITPNSQLSTCLLFCQREVELLLFEISLSHLDLYRVTKLILVVVSAAHEAVVTLVEVVIVVVEIAHGYKSFAVVLVYLAVYSVRLNA